MSVEQIKKICSNEEVKQRDYIETDESSTEECEGFNYEQIISADKLEQEILFDSIPRSKNIESCSDGKLLILGWFLSYFLHLIML